LLLVQEEGCLGGYVPPQSWQEGLKTIRRRSKLIVNFNKYIASSMEGVMQW
jgi:hypothetical protein